MSCSGTSRKPSMSGAAKGSSWLSPERGIGSRFFMRTYCGYAGKPGRNAHRVGEEGL